MWIKWSSDVSDGTTWWIKNMSRGGGDTYKNSKLFLKFYLDQENFVEKKETITNFGIKVCFLKVPYFTPLLHSSGAALHD